MKILPFLILTATLAAPLTTARCAGIPDRPEKLAFPPLKYEPPAPDQFRVQLQSGPVAYIVPDRERPLVNLSVTIRTGKYLEPAGKEGLASFTGYLLTHGGAGTNSAAQLEERLAFLGAQLSSDIGDTQGSVTLNLLSKDLDEGLALLRDVLYAPRFQDDRIALQKQQTLQAIKQRNDNSAAIEGRETGFLANGGNFWANRYSTSNSIDSITSLDIKKFHRQWFWPSNFIVAVTGDFDREQMISKLENVFGNCPYSVLSDFPSVYQTPPPIPTNITFAAPGVYFVNKPDVNQGRVSLMLPGITRDNPDYYAVIMMNDILGGGGFTSRIMNRIRSDEGLAYSAYSSFPGGVYYPGVFTIAFQSKSRTAAYAASIALEETKRIAAQPVSDEELSLAKKAFIASFPNYFNTKEKIAEQFARDEFTGRYAKTPQFWKTFRANIEAVTKDDVARVAKKYLAADQFVVFIVGNEADILLGYPTHPVDLKTLFGKFHEWPLRDPLTMKPQAQ
jgi:predicted Zn-dependent peptidase